MSVQPLNLVERAAERLRQTGSLDPSTAQLLEADRHSDAPPGRSDTAFPPDPAGGLNGSQGRAPNLRQNGASPPRRTDGPFVGTAALERAGMIAWSKGRSRVSEEFRIIQGQILRAAFAPQPSGQGHAAGPQQGLPNLVMVSSARPGEGKSFTSLNLALSIARQQDHEVLLVDTDSKDQSVGRLLGLGNTPGLLDLALDPTLNADDLIIPTEFDKLSVLPIGSQPEKSPELFATRQMARLIRDLGRRYSDRVVILDAAPCLSSSDPSTLAPIVGQIVVVVEAERTQRAEVEAALDLIQACPTISLLLNKVQVTTSHTFGAYASAYTSG